MNDTNAAFGTGQGTIVVPNSDDNNNVDYRFVVGRITWGATASDDDVIDIFLPDTNLNLGSVHSTLTVDVDQSGYDTISFARGDKVVMDEIRFGASYADVSPIPEPSAAALAGLLFGLGLLRRRR
jgi:MYXO-CTERM domain-containing protein